MGVFVVEASGGEYSDKWSVVECVCLTEERAKEIVAKKEERKRILREAEKVLKQMYADWCTANPEYKRFFEFFKGVDVPKWKAGGHIPDDFRKERDAIRNKNTADAKAFYEKLHAEKEVFHLKRVEEVKKFLSDNGFNTQDFGVDEITCDFNYSTKHVSDVNYTYYEVPIME